MQNMGWTRHNLSKSLAGKTMRTISTFQYDCWAPKPVAALAVGDLISHGGKVATVTAVPYEEAGVTHIPATVYEPGPIKVMLGDDRKHITMAMDLVASGLAEFDDGTALITDLEAGHNLVYSPRLPVAELEAFCAEYIECYQAFYDTNAEAIDNGRAIPMTPWWQGVEEWQEERRKAQRRSEVIYLMAVRLSLMFSIVKRHMKICGISRRGVLTARRRITGIWRWRHGCWRRNTSAAPWRLGRFSFEREPV
ncbi:hypothetical protein [Alkalilimnicola ehrlichii]|uniref:hypothetical protein n=1 Tax=Alkalilimnicola ehrlichii TaxID=351052 RepID=UPI0011C08051|nr:hypothetical protein [Alkalilimnicola ehrlichii]